MRCFRLEKGYVSCRYVLKSSALIGSICLHQLTPLPAPRALASWCCARKPGYGTLTNIQRPPNFWPLSILRLLSVCNFLQRYRNEGQNLRKRFLLSQTDWLANCVSFHAPPLSLSLYWACGTFILLTALRLFRSSEKLWSWYSTQIGSTNLYETSQIFNWPKLK